MSTIIAPSSPNLPKKGPGRPPSTKNVTPNIILDDYSEPVSVFPSLLPQTANVKKKSGRPRKNPSSPQSTPSKRSRGRPRKNGRAVSSTTPEDQNTENKVSSKKRGRPKKNTPVVETLKENKDEEHDDEEHEEEDYDEEDELEEEHEERGVEEYGAEADEDAKTKLLKLITGVKEAVYQLRPHVNSLSIPDATAALNSLEELVDL